VTRSPRHRRGAAPVRRPAAAEGLLRAGRHRHASQLAALPPGVVPRREQVSVASFAPLVSEP